MGGGRKRKASSTTRSTAPDDEDDSHRRQRRARTSSSSSRHHSSSSGDMWGGGGGSSRRKGGSRGGSRGGGSSGDVINEASATKMFTDIADKDDPYVATMEGICQLCGDLDIDPMEDVRILVLLWKMGANKHPAQINKDEWIQGCQKLQADTIDKFKALLPSLDTGFLDRTEFKDFYKFCFQFNREGTHRTLDKELVVGLLQMILKGRIPDDRLETFTTFLEQSKDESYSRITLDQWTSFLDFCYECEDISDYDEATSAWPVLIDEYVEYMENKK